jgi:hypothetical protein
VLSSKFTSPYIWRENLFTEGAKPSEDEDVQNKEASLSLMLIFASIIRDFIVVEERQSLFSTKPSKENRCRINRELSVIYLPRVIYTENPNVRNYVERFGKDIPRSAHDVSGHIRKVEKASPVQIILAQKYGFHIPQGYTFVRPHRRGTEAEKAIKKIYRSRTASSVIYRVLDTAPKGTRPMWFEFEKDVARFMKALGLTVIHVSSSGKGDGGIDVYAHNEVTDEIFAIQCKCYAPGYKVGPDVIRELSGTLNKYPEGIKGMILTTSSFTKGALEEAVTLGIEVINGQDFVNMAKGQI